MMKNIRTYIMDTEGLNDRNVFFRLYQTVSDSRKKKIDKYIRQKDKNLSLAASLLLSYSLREYGIGSFELEYGENGKPYIRDKNVFFNLSHSEKRAMCVVSCDEVGCDTERITDIDFEIAHRFFNRSECALLDELTDISKKRDLFFRIWTLKESFMKATGLGMSLGLDSFSINLSGGEITAEHTVNAHRYYFKEYDLCDGYRYAVCGLSPYFAEKAEFVNIKNMI